MTGALYTQRLMTGQVEIAIAAPGLREPGALDAAVDRAATAIYAAFPHGGPCVAGDSGAGTLSLLLSVDNEAVGEWLPQLQVLCAAVDGPIERVAIGPFVEAAA